MTNDELHGIIVPVITPVDDRDDVDEAAFRKVLRRLIDAGVHGLFVGGSAGEGPLLADAQWRRMVEIAFNEVGDAAPLLAGVMDTSARRVCAKIALLRQIGYRHFVATATFYIAVKTPSEQLRLFGQAKEAAGEMEMMAYNIPQCTGSVLAVETVCEMARRGWIRCCKESSGDWPYMTDMIGRGKEVGLTVLTGDESRAGEAVLAGARGIVPVCANYDPATYVHLYDAAVRGDRDEVARRMERIRLLMERLVRCGPNWLCGTKYALAAVGIGSGRPVSPLEPSDAPQKAVIDALIHADGGSTPC